MIKWYNWFSKILSNTELFIPENNIDEFNKIGWIFFLLETEIPLFLKNFKCDFQKHPLEI